ncbi:hypothetical protein WAI453_011377 [Rhynchosporium graminicola]
MEVLTPAYLSTIPFLNSSISFPASFGQNIYHMSFGGRGIPWNEGEKEMHRIMHVAGQGNPNSPFLSPGAGYMIQDAPLRLDPVVEALLGNAVDGEVVRGDGEGRMVGGLTIDLESRMRIKLHGNMIAGAVEEKGVGQMQLVVSINKSVGNCPKYLNSKRIIPSTPQPKLKSDSAQLPPEALALLDKADMFFHVLLEWLGHRHKSSWGTSWSGPSNLQ